MKKIIIIGAMVALFLFMQNTTVVASTNYEATIAKAGEQLIQLIDINKGDIVSELIYEKIQNRLNNDFDELSFEKKDAFRKIEEYLRKKGYYNKTDMERYENTNLGIRLLVPQKTRAVGGGTERVQLILNEEKVPLGYNGSIYIKSESQPIDEYASWQIYSQRLEKDYEVEEIDTFIKERYRENCAFDGFNQVEGKSYSNIVLAAVDDSQPCASYAHQIRFYPGTTYNTLVQWSIGHDTNFGVGQREFDWDMIASFEVFE